MVRAHTRLLLLLALFPCIAARSGPAEAGATGPESIAAHAADGRGGEKAPAAAVAGKSYMFHQIEMKSEKARAALQQKLARDHAAATHFVCACKQFLDIFISYDPAKKKHDEAGQKAADAIRRDSGYRWDDWGRVIDVPPPPRKPPTGGKRAGGEDEIVRGPARKLTGKGVIVAIIDTGIDFRNPDFLAPDGKTSRVLYYWDTFAKKPAEKGAPGTKVPAPATLPDKTPIGAVYTREELTKAIEDNDTTIAGDTGGHGTACANIAAGNGKKSEGEHRGVAPEADIIAVRIGNGTRGEKDERSMRHAYLLTCICGWLDEIAGARPLVISCSFGGQYAARDGNTVAERHLSERFHLSRPGRVLCISAGNDRYYKFHAEVRLQGKGDRKTLKWNAPSGGWLSLFFDRADTRGIRFEGKQGDALAKKLFVHPLSGRAETYVKVNEGKGELTVHSDMPTLIADAYIDSEGKKDALFDDACVSRHKVIGSPGTARSAITVGSYDFNNTVLGEVLEVPVSPAGTGEMRPGAFSAYSSPGPSRGGEVKPDLAAPGQYWTVSLPRQPGGGRPRGPEFGNFNGTSAATPYVAGVIALMLEANRELTAGEIKALLAKHCRAKPDRFVQEHGQLPSPEWGHGKLNKAAVEAILDEVLAGKKRTGK